MTRGQGSWFTVEEGSNGGYRWSAFGPAGVWEGRLTRALTRKPPLATHSESSTVPKAPRINQSSSGHGEAEEQLRALERNVQLGVVPDAVEHYSRQRAAGRTKATIGRRAAGRRHDAEVERLRQKATS